MINHTATFLSSVLEWLRAGYPDGIPPKDRLPVLALLRRRLSDDELDQIVGTLAAEGKLDIGTTEITAAINEVATFEPDGDDIAQVSAKLAAVGWPLASDPA